jgi:hypothetical protein
VSIVNIQLEATKDVYANQAYPNTNYDGSRKDFYVRSYADKNIGDAHLEQPARPFSLADRHCNYQHHPQRLGFLECQGRCPEVLS